MRILLPEVVGRLALEAETCSGKRPAIKGLWSRAEKVVSCVKSSILLFDHSLRRGLHHLDEIDVENVFVLLGESGNGVSHLAGVVMYDEAGITATLEILIAREFAV